MSLLKEKIKALLRYSERYMKTDMVYLARGGFWLVLGQGISMIAGLLLVVGFANLLPKEIYGNYKFILSLAGIIGAFTLTGMGTAVTQAVARGFDGAFRTGFWVQLKWSGLMVLAALVGAIYYFVNDNNVIATSLLIVGAFSPVITSTSLYGSFLSGKKDFKMNAIYGIFKSLIPATTLLATLFFTQDVVIIILAYFLSHTATSSVLFLRVLQKYRPAREADLSHINFSKHLSITNILSIVAIHVDKILIFHFLGAVQLAIYGIAYSMPAQLKIFNKIINTLVFPKMSSASLETIKSAIYPKAMRLFVGFGLIIALYILAAPFIYRILFPQYLEAIFLSQAIALGFIFSPAILFSQTFIAQKRQKEIYINKVVAAIIRILLLLILLPLLGIWGAVYAFFLGNAVSFVISLILFRRLEIKNEVAL